MKKDNKHRSRTQGAWLQEVAAIDLQIRERQNEVKLLLWHDPTVFKVTVSELCRYLSAHSNLGSPESIRQALYRMRKML